MKPGNEREWRNDVVVEEAKRRIYQTATTAKAVATFKKLGLGDP
jgi:hypothetical protein